MSDQRGDPQPRIVLPPDLERRLSGFRSRVRWIKLVEALCGAAFGVLIGYLVVFGMDRLTETPSWIRLAALAAAVAACAAIPVACHRWIWGQRGLEQVARLVGRRFPSLGDQLLGIIELVRDAERPAVAATNRSGALCKAAIDQVAERSRSVDFSAAVPHPRHRGWLAAAVVPACLALAAAWFLPDAAANAWQRFLAPWRTIERFTFTRVEPLPEAIVVPHGEPTTLAVPLSAETRARPERATAWIGRQQPLAADLKSDRYSFTLPPQLSSGPLTLAAGDARARARIEPKLRPEIVGLVAAVRLPEYLGRPAVLRQEIRGGSLTAVAGSDVELEATANRELAAATAAGRPVTPVESVIRTPSFRADEETTIEITWRDRHGLDGSRPLSLVLVPRPDESPTVVAIDLPENRDVLLNTDTLRFRVAVRDDFGIRRVGLEWEGMSDWSSGTDDPAAVSRGERLLQTGANDLESLEAAATFCPDALGIEPQPIVLRAFAEDYKPGRGRAYSTPLLIYVVDRAEHALVLNTRLQQFRQQASEVRDREMALLATNKELRDLPGERLGDPDVRGRLEAQAAAEEANARRLERLVDEGSKLVREAMKNPDFEAATLEQLAEDIQTLADIAESRMPGVADLLGQAAQASRATAGEAGQSGRPSPGRQQPSSDQAAAEQAQPQPDDSGDQGQPGEQPPRVGEDRSRPGGGGGSPPPEGGQPPVPQVVDRESSQQPEGDSPPGQQSQPGGAGRLGLPTTQAGVSRPGEPAEPGEQEPSAEESLDEAIAKQEELLEEFAKVADELAAVMARLEGSTFVKRFKLASRRQAAIGGRLAGMAAEAFGPAGERPAGVSAALGDVKDMNARETETVSVLMDDLQAYFDRRQLPAFRTVLEEMKELDALGSLRQLSDDILTEAGMSIAQAEFWSDTFDRLADDLVPPRDGGGGGGGGGAPRESVPPEVVLETMKILEEEVNLREETRVVQQTREAVAGDAFAAAAGRLADRQEGLADRIVDLVDRLLEEPDGERQFAQEIQLFDKVEEVMVETADLLGTPETGQTAIAAETEVIELLLAAQAACSNCNGGGGGGGSGGTPGGGGTGTASSSALALVGGGNRTRAEAGGEDEQATGVSGRVLPDEFRSGLDAYFNRLEKERR